MVHMDAEIKTDLERNILSQPDSCPKQQICNSQSAQIHPPHEVTNNIILYPFAHQVGGHTQLLTLDKSTICKPLIPRELLFYLNTPSVLQKFVPSYKGVVQIKNSDSSRKPVLHQPIRSPKSPYRKLDPGSSSTLPAKFESLESGGHIDETLELKVQIRLCTDEKVLRKNLSQDNLLKADYISRPNDKYLLLLENVASKYRMPCILDLKMGTRQHDDNASEEKRHRQIAKCNASTSSTLGVRLCGMQVYQVNFGGYLWYDKYYGRKMDEAGLKQALHQYFHDGFQFNHDLIDDVIDRLKLLTSAIEKSPSFRFYGTSLLIIHEGCTSSPSFQSCPVDVRLIDFAHTICHYNNPGSSCNARSSSYPSVLRTSSSFDKIESSLFNYNPLQQVSLPFSTNNNNNNNTVDNKKLENSASSNNISKTNDINSYDISATLDETLAEVSEEATTKSTINNNVNLLDTSCGDLGSGKYASSTNDLSTLTYNSCCKQDLDDNMFVDCENRLVSDIISQPSSRKVSKSIGPDKGLLFGLTNLMRLLDDLKSQYKSQEQEEEEEEEEEDQTSPQTRQRQPTEAMDSHLYIPVS